ncbi:hypothetical protein BJY52DRAFT_1237844 [Lactarius psammicola]|nr:hypothetical protein BJY52DRAFT_1237844 [Lactarius psammicola]
MSDAFPPSTAGSCVHATAPVVRYPPEYFGFGAAGFRHVSTVLDDLALAASSVQTALPSAKPLPLTTGPQLNGRLESNRRTLPTRRRGGPLAPYSAMRDSRGYSIWRTVIDNIPSPSKERITATYLGCCDGISAGDWSTLRKHLYLKDEDLQYIPIGLCPACPEDLGCRDEGQRVDIYGQKGRHFDTCTAYRALCERTNTKPEPILTNRAAVKALLEERDRLRITLRFRTPKNAPPTFPITPLPILTPVAHALLEEGARDPNSIEQQHFPIGSTSVPSLTLSPSSSTASSRVLTPTEQTDLQNTYSLNLDVSSPAYFPPNNMTDHGVLANLGANTSEDLDLHAGVFQEEITVKGCGGLFLSPGELLPPESFPVHAAQQRLSSLPPELYELISAALEQRN